jgi:hypothetical protein
MQEEDVIDLLAEEPVLDELVNDRKDDRMDSRLGGETGARGEGEENARGEDEEEESRRQKIPHLFAFYVGKSLELHQARTIRTRLVGAVLRHKGLMRKDPRRTSERLRNALVGTRDTPHARTVVLRLQAAVHHRTADRDEVGKDANRDEPKQAPGARKLHLLYADTLSPTITGVAATCNRLSQGLARPPQIQEEDDGCEQDDSEKHCIVWRHFSHTN